MGGQPSVPGFDRVTIRCAACAGPITIISAKAAAAFASGEWLCADAECHRRRRSAADAAAGRLDLTG